MIPVLHITRQVRAFEGLANGQLLQDVPAMNWLGVLYILIVLYSARYNENPIKVKFMAAALSFVMKETL